MRIGTHITAVTSLPGQGQPVGKKRVELEISLAKFDGRASHLLCRGVIEKQRRETTNHCSWRQPGRDSPVAADGHVPHADARVEVPDLEGAVGGAREYELLRGVEAGRRDLDGLVAAVAHHGVGLLDEARARAAPWVPHHDARVHARRYHLQRAGA